MNKILLVLTFIFGFMAQVYGEVVPVKTVKPMARETVFDETKEGVLVDQKEFVFNDPEEEFTVDEPVLKKPKVPEVVERTEERVVYVEPRGPVTRAADTVVDAADDVAVAAGDVVEAAAEVPARVLGVL